MDHTTRNARIGSGSSGGDWPANATELDNPETFLDASAVRERLVELRDLGAPFAAAWPQALELAKPKDRVVLQQTVYAWASAYANVGRRWGDGLGSEHAP